MEDYNPQPTEDEIAKAISHPVLANLNARLENLQSQLTASQDTAVRLRDKYRTAEHKVEALLKEWLIEDQITMEMAQSLADIFDNISLTKQVELSYSVSGTITVEVPITMEDDHIESNVFIDRVEADTYESDIEVLEVSFDTDSLYTNQAVGFLSLSKQYRQT